MNAVLEAALDYASRGWRVLPVRAGTKVPLVARWPKAATTDWGTIRDWWTRWPDAGVGIATGRGSGLVVLDIDPRNAGWVSLDVLEARHGKAPAAPWAWTGGGGVHAYFRAPGSTRTTKLAPGLDLKAEGGFVVAPPSHHPSGERYRWAEGEGPDDNPLADSSWLLALLQARASVAEDSAGGRPAASPQSGADGRRWFLDAWRGLGLAVGPGERLYLCPFHPDHDPSLSIDADRLVWKCFGCGKGGGLVALARESGTVPPSGTARTLVAEVRAWAEEHPEHWTRRGGANRRAVLDALLVRVEALNGHPTPEPLSDEELDALLAKLDAFLEEHDGAEPERTGPYDACEQP